LKRYFMWFSIARAEWSAQWNTWLFHYVPSRNTHSCSKFHYFILSIYGFIQNKQGASKQLKHTVLHINFNMFINNSIAPELRIRTKFIVIFEVKKLWTFNNLFIKFIDLFRSLVRILAILENIVSTEALILVTLIICYLYKIKITKVLFCVHHLV
jgi:hypothetical protein